MNWDLSAAVQRLLAFRSARDWQRFHQPKELAAAIAIEAAELQELFLWRERETADEVTADPQRLEKIREEIADIAIFLLLATHDLRIDLVSRVRSNET